MDIIYKRLKILLSNNIEEKYVYPEEAPLQYIESCVISKIINEGIINVIEIKYIYNLYMYFI